MTTSPAQAQVKQGEKVVYKDTDQKVEFKSYAELKTALYSDQNLLDILPEIFVKGAALSPTAIYVNGDKYPEEVPQDKVKSISLVYSAPPTGDVRIQVNKDNSAYISGYIGGRGVRGGTTHIKDGVLNTFQNFLENNKDLLKAMELSVNIPNNLPTLPGVRLAEGTNAPTVPNNNSGPRSVA